MRAGPDRQTALRLASHYERRWDIKEFFRLLKSGLRVENRRLSTFESLRNAMVPAVWVRECFFGAKRGEGALLDEFPVRQFALDRTDLARAQHSSGPNGEW